MSIKNKSKDRDSKGRIRRKYTSPNCDMHTPMWWVREMMNRPQRKMDKEACRKICKGHDPDEVLFSLPGNKPHIYYW